MLPWTLDFLGLLNAALVELGRESNYDPAGSMSPEDTAHVFRVMLEGMDDLSWQIGWIVPYITASAPDGTLPCDGSTHLRADWPTLYSLLDSAFIVDADTFRTPDLRGRTVIGTGQGAGLTNRALNASGGAETHTLSEPEMPIHSHTYTPPAPNIDLESPGAPDLIAAGLGLPTQTGTAGGGNAHNNMPPFLALNYCLVGR